MKTNYSPEDRLHQEMESIADQLYDDIWGPLKRLEHLSHNPGGEVHPLDKDWAIDVILQTQIGLPVTIQDKFRDYHYYELYNQFTLEYENDPMTHVPGEFYHLIANYYFYGFAALDKRSFVSWKVIDLNRFKDSYLRNEIKEDGRAYNWLKGRASFLYFGWDKLRRYGLLFRDSEAAQ